MKIRKTVLLELNPTLIATLAESVTACHSSHALQKNQMLISEFYREVDENCSLWDYYVASSVSS
jgi:hypothetical protein